MQAIETMLQCFCEDCERNDGSPMHPYYMPTKLKRLILASDQKPQQDQRAIKPAGETSRPAPSLMSRLRDSMFKLQDPSQTQQAYITLT